VGREALDTALAAGLSVRGFVDDRLAGSNVRGLPVSSVDEAPNGGTYVIAIADPAVRLRLATALDGRGLTAIILIHPRATVALETTVAPGCLVFGGAYISSSVTIAPHCQVHYNATVGHDAVLDEYVTVYPGANVSGAVHLGAGSTVGSGAVVLQGRAVGAGAFIGAGAVVTRDVAPGAVVVGAPARPLR
jgi:sugar O-acyltransferase (sialic acid O-acetyltransferase NeuD family)